VEQFAKYRVGRRDPEPIRRGHAGRAVKWEKLCGDEDDLTGLLQGPFSRACEPAKSVRLQGVHAESQLFCKVTCGTLESAFLETPLTRGDAGNTHPVLANRAHRPVHVNTHHYLTAIRAQLAYSEENKGPQCPGL
jgi:hypothetical protein